MEVPLQTWNHDSPDNYAEAEDVILNQSGEDKPGTCTDCGRLNKSMAGREPDICLKCERENVDPAALKVPDETMPQAQNNGHVINDVLPSPPASPVKDNSHVLPQMQSSQSKNEGHQQRFPHNTSPPQRRQRRRNDRGLFSTTRIPNVTDNRYMVINLSAEESAKMEPPIKPVRRSNFKSSHKVSCHSKRGSHFEGNSPIQHNRPTSHRANEATGNENYSKTHYNANQSNYEQFVYDDIDQDDNLDSLEDIPAYDDIPYALLITGSLDEATIKKAKQKQNQREALEQIKLEASLKSRTKGISKNKNLEYTSDRKPPVTYKVQDGTSITTNTEEHLDLLDESLSQIGDDSLVPTDESLIKSDKLQNQSLNDDSNLEDQTFSDTNVLSPYESANELMKTLGAMHRDIYTSQCSREDIGFRKKNDKDTDEALQNTSFEQMLSFTDKRPIVDEKGDSVMTVRGPLRDVPENMVFEPRGTESPTETIVENDKEIIPSHTSQTGSNIETNAHGSSETNALADGAQKESNDLLKSPHASDLELIKTEVDVSYESLEGSDGFANESNFSYSDNDEHKRRPIEVIASPMTDQSKRQFTESSHVRVYPKSPIKQQDAQGDNDRQITSPSATQIDMVNQTQSSSREVNLEVDAHSRVLGIVVSDSGNMSIPISKASNDDHKDKEHPMQRKETDEEKFIRMKRLERLEAMNINAQQQKDIQNKPTKKPDDHRNKAVHIDDASKPVKAKVFKNRTSSFRISEKSSDVNKSDFNASSNERKQLCNVNEVTRGGTNTDQTQDDHDIMKTQVDVSNGRKLLENKIKRPNTETNQPKRQNKNSVKPSALKLLQSRTAMSTPASSDKHEEKNSDEYSAPKHERANTMRSSIAKGNQIGLSPIAFGKTKQSQEKKPATMRLLERMKKRSSRMQDILSVLSSYEDSARAEATKTKEPKGKNKNMASGGVNSSKGHKVISETKNDDQDLRPSTISSNGFERAEDKASSAAKLRHEAFRILAADQSGNQIKCSACGRPECEGQSVRQMRELVRIAKENGFDIRDVSPDGNCMFAAIVDQLMMYGDSRYDSKSLREAAVYWLIEHPRADDGTHYSNFISRDWESYLQRMFVEGEWGDHVILRAIVEIVGHTVKVFHVSGNDSHWTVLEPSTVDVSKDGIHLVLGHVGEFHYTSLRPSDTLPSYIPSTASPSESLEEKHTKEIKLEGGETIDMFSDDYIDTMSEFPACHFSYLLKTVMSMKCVDDAAISSSDYIDLLQSTYQYRDTQVQFYGPAADGVFHCYLFSNMQSEGDTNAMVEAAVILDYKYDDLCSIIEEGQHPGFVRIAISPYGIETNRCLPSQALPLPIGAQYAGKSYYSYKSTSHVSMSVKSWPDMAQSWISRVRTEEWPSAELINSIVEAGYTVIPYCHPMSLDPHNECQILFVSAEHKLFHEAMSKHQKYCFIMFIAFCVQTMHDNKSISYRHFKHVFFYACERIPSEYWETRPGSCVLYLIDMLMRCVKARNLPNYFIENYNMIDHLTDSDIRDLDERLLLLRSQPALFLKNINSNLERSSLIDSIIDRVSQDVPLFSHQRNLKSSVLNVFVPATIDLARGYIGIRHYAHGYELLSSAFQERLSISTCDDMVPYQMFLFGAVSGLDLDTLVWFSAYTDKQLEGQLSKSVIRETCGDLVLTKIQNILPPEICGSFGNIEVPLQFAQTPCSFCSSLARFLFCVHKTSDILPVLQYCHRIFKEKQSGNVSNSTQTSQTNIDFNAFNMFEIYTAMFYVNQQQGRLDSFRSVMPEVDAVCVQIGNRGAFSCLKYLYKMVGDETNMSAAAKKYAQLPIDDYEQYFIRSFNSWPYRG